MVCADSAHTTYQYVHKSQFPSNVTGEYNFRTSSQWLELGGSRDDTTLRNVYEQHMLVEFVDSIQIQEYCTIMIHADVSRCSGQGNAGPCSHEHNPIPYTQT